MKRLQVFVAKIWKRLFGKQFTLKIILKRMMISFWTSLWWTVLSQYIIKKDTLNVSDDFIL